MYCVRHRVEQIMQKKRENQRKLNGGFQRIGGMFDE